MLYLASSSSDSDFDSTSTGSGESSKDGGEFRPPAGSLRTMKTQRMNLRSSPRKNPPLEVQHQGRETRRSSQQKMMASFSEALRARDSAEGSSNGQRHQQQEFSPKSAVSPRQSPRKRLSTTGPSPAPAKNEEESPSPSPQLEKAGKLMASAKTNWTSPKRANRSPPETPDGSPLLAKNSSKMLLLAAKRRRRSVQQLVRQNAVVQREKGRREGIRAARGRRPSSMAQPKREILSSEDEEEEGHGIEDMEEDEEEDGIDDEDLFQMAADFSTDEEEGKSGESSEEEEKEKKPSLLLNAVKQLESGPKRRGRKPAMRNGEKPFKMVANNIGRKRTNNCKTHQASVASSSTSATMNDFSNPYEADLVNGEMQPMELYQRKMRDLVDLDRYLGQPDFRGFSRRPVHRPFLMRNLFYMQKQRPLPKNYSSNRVANGDLLGLKNQLPRRPNSSAIGAMNGRGIGTSRTGSRASHKMPATIKFTLIRNNNCFGKKSAIVQCFHATEVNGRLSPLKRIPSATFEKAVNEKISTHIEIDMLEECQAGVLDGKVPRIEHFVVRVVFRLEDAEIGGRHLRKVPSRQSGEHGNASGSANGKCLRKNGPTETKEVVMFGAVRIFSHSPGDGLRAATGEAHILLHTAGELHLDDLNTKSSAGQLARLINAPNKTSGDVPFIRIVVLNEDDEDEEEEEEEEDEEEEEEELIKNELAIERMMEELAELEAAATSSPQPNGGPGIGTRRTATGNGTASGGVLKEPHQGLLQEPPPERIAIKFLLHPPTNANAHSSLSSALSPLSYQANGQPGVKRPKLQLSDSSGDERMEGMGEDSCMELEDEELAMKAQFGLMSGFDSGLELDVAKREFALRQIAPSVCFLCKARLRLRNLWTLLKHLRFTHPRFQFTYEPSITVGGPPKSSALLPGFTVSLNTRFDASFELRQPIGRKNSWLGNHLGSGSPIKNGGGKRKHQPLLPQPSRPVWLVTKALAQKARANEDFPVERFTALSHGHWGEYEYLLSTGRFQFETPTRVDQQWLLQSGSRKLEDITDLHPAERLMMQLWNGFLPRIRITLIGHKMAYPAARVFILHHWRHLEEFKLRTHFLLHLTTLLNANAIDEEERYDLLMRLDGPARADGGGYRPQEDEGHLVTRELRQLERERHKMQSQQLAAQAQQQQQGAAQQQQEGGGRLDKQLRQKATTTTSTESVQHQLHGHKQQQQPRIASASPPSSNSSSSNNNSSLEFASLAELRARYPWAAGKRLAQIWKFLRHYDFDDFPMISTGAPGQQQKQAQAAAPMFWPSIPPSLPAGCSSSSASSSSAASSASSGFFSPSTSSSAATTASTSSWLGRAVTGTAELLTRLTR